MLAIDRLSVYNGNEKIERKNKTKNEENES